ncbi:MAG TPA: HNH endonuclease signature motif containing protein [Gemmatimonadaceae bacterium]|nr:HNH endonuclease signature motif containing protein [Gemmatimonadaceae bacterium]
MPGKPKSAARKAAKRPAAAPAAPAAKKTKRRRGGSRRGKGGGGGGDTSPSIRLTSVPTGRQAYTDTRHWLLERHGPVCAYCERVVSAATITLDHVTPRRGQTAYDRRDNLVLCCKTCNAAKADKPILAFLLGNRKRVVALYKYGHHLSHQLVEMVKDLLPEWERPPLPSKPAKPRRPRRTWAEIYGASDDGVSPYEEESPYLE